jgi:mRNA-degrading endonuclease RelE of RelBE toxin-antitoxin system
VKRLAKKNPDIPEMFAELLEILSTDPLNASHRYQLKKLTNVAPGDRQWRIRSGVYRLHYDVVATP